MHVHVHVHFQLPVGDSWRCTAVTAAVLTSVVDDFGAQDGGHLQHSDEGLVHRGEGEGRHTVPPGHLSDVHGTVTWKSTGR